MLGYLLSDNFASITLFQPHTEWISKGKAGMPVELGMQMCIMEDTNILHHRIIQKKMDDKIALEIVSATQFNLPSFNTYSFNKGFHSPKNQLQLKEKLEHVVLSKKGRLSSVDK